LGFFICKHSENIPEPGIYILFNRIRDFVDRLGYKPLLKPEELAYFVLVQEQESEEWEEGSEEEEEYY